MTTIQESDQIGKDAFVFRFESQNKQLGDIIG